MVGNSTKVALSLYWDLANLKLSKTLWQISYLCLTATYKNNCVRGEIRELISLFGTNTLEERNL
jgi:hypothetical protein